MSWLKKVGQVLGVVTQLLTGIGPFIVATTPTKKDDQALAAVGDWVTHIAALVATAEAMGQAAGLPGATKAKMLAPLIGQAILQSQFMVGKKIKDEALWTKAMLALGGDFADAFNALDEGSVKTEDRA